MNADPYPPCVLETQRSGAMSICREKTSDLSQSLVALDQTTTIV
jgi:hypothetical protein